jgi:hemerythrin superfamily protein
VIVMTDTQRDVVDVLTADHREFDRIFTELEGLFGRTGPDVLKRKRELVDEVTIGLVKHSVAEETRVYPRVATEIDKEQAEHSKHEHAEAEETMKRLERMDPDDAGFDGAVVELIREIRHHVQEEESRMFPELRTRVPREELVKMAEQVEAIKKIAPTRAHPSTPNEAGVRLAVGPVASLLDHLRDAVSGRGKSSD